MSRCFCPNRLPHMGENPERWDLPEILPCRACITRNFSSPEFYHLNCNAETEDTICDYCATHDIECMHIPDSLAYLCCDIYWLRKIFFKTKAAKTRAVALISLDLKVKEFNRKLEEIEKEEDREWGWGWERGADGDADNERGQEAEDPDEFDIRLRRDQYLIDDTFEDCEPTVGSVLQEIDELLDGWMRIGFAYQKIENIAREMREIKKVFNRADEERGAGDDPMQADEV